jgi:hypothetical protein
MLNSTDLQMVEKLVPSVADVSKVNELNSSSFENYITAKRNYLISLYDTYKTSGISTDLDIFNSAIAKFSSMETNMAASLQVDRKETLRDFFLVSNGYKDFSGTEYETKMSAMKAPDLITLNGMVSTLANLSPNAFVSGGLSSIDTFTANLNPATVVAAEKALATGLQSSMSNEIITSAMNKIWEDKKEFFTDFLKFKNWVS